MNTIALTSSLVVLCYITLQVTGKDPHWSYPEFVEPQTYINSVLESLERKVNDHGVQLLRLNDTTRTVNKTVYNIYLDGTIKYSSGVVLAIEKFSNKTMQTFVGSEDAWITCEAWLYNVSIAYDIDVDLTNLPTTRGVALLRFPENYFGFTLNKKWIDNDAKVTVSDGGLMGVRGPKTDYSPDSAAMRAVAYDARLTLSTVFFDALDDWSKNVFRGFLQEIVSNEFDFPITDVESPRALNSSGGA